GLTPKRVVVILYAFCGAGAALSLLLNVFQASFGGLIIVLFCAGAGAGVYRLGYAEFGIAGRMLRARTFQRLLNAHVSLRSFEQALRSAPDLEVCWSAISEITAEFGFEEVTLTAPGRTYSRGRGDARSWTIAIPLGNDSWIHLRRNSSGSTPPLLAPLADLMRDVLTSRMHELLPPADDPAEVAAASSL